MIRPVMTHFTCCEPARDGAGGVFMPIAPSAAAEYPGSTRNAHLCSAWVSTLVCWRTHHAASHPRTPRHPCLWPRRLLHTARSHRAAAGQGLPYRLLIVVGPSCSFSDRWAATIARFSTLLARDAEVRVDGGTEHCDGRALGGHAGRAHACPRR